MSIDEHLGTGEYSPEKYWSERAKNYNGDYFKAVCAFVATKTENRSMDRVQRYFMKIALKKLNITGKNVIEFGCGIGRWIRLYQKKGYNWTGVDISDEMLSIAASRFQNVKLEKVRDGYLIPFPDNSFDLIYSITVLHHNDYEQQEKIISEMVRVLKNGGSMILLEDFGGKNSFNMFARCKNSWFDLVERYHMKNIWYQEIRYWILRDIVLLRRILTKLSLWNIWRKSIGFIDLLFDSYLIRYFPCKNPRAAIMIFEKQKAD
jgi:ubiquinone/menaquinone biosynthesis C-methylase UbiE